METRNVKFTTGFVVDSFDMLFLYIALLLMYYQSV